MPLSTEQRSKIFLLLNKAIDEFKNDHTVIYPSESHRLKYLNYIGELNYKYWNMSRPCIFEGCSKRSIIKSHTLQKSGPLSLLSEDNHLVQPKFSSNNKYEMKRVGVNRASTFPGFCQEHEDLFSEFEKNKKISSDDDYGWQMFRTISRELARLAIDISYFKKLRQSYLVFRNTYLTKNLDKILTDTDQSLEKIIFGKDRYERTLSDGIKRKLELSKKISEGVLKDISRAIEGDLDAPIFKISFDQILPVCISGMGVIASKDESNNLVFTDAFICVFPNVEKTEILLSCKSNDLEILSNYIAEHLNGKLSILSAVESWMIYQTDHWFMRPSIWGEMTQKKKDAILNAMCSESSSMGKELDFSIFDRERRQLLSELIGSKEYFEFEKIAKKTVLRENGRLCREQ